MTYISKIISSSLLAGSLLVGAATAVAQELPGKFYLEETVLHPSKSKAFTEGWKTVIKHADDHDYAFDTYVSRSGPRISIATPISSYGDIDRIIAERNRVYEAGGTEFADAIKAMDGATYSNSSFVATHHPEISNPPSPEDMANFTIFEISEAQVNPGKTDQFKAVLASYKNKLDENGLLDTVKYNVYTGGVGTEGQFFFQTFAKDRVEEAQNSAKINAIFKEDEGMGALFEEFLTIETAGANGGSEYWTMSDELSFDAD